MHTVVLAWGICGNHSLVLSLHKLNSFRLPSWLSVLGVVVGFQRLTTMTTAELLRSSPGFQRPGGEDRHDRQTSETVQCGQRKGKIKICSCTLFANPDFLFQICTLYFSLQQYCHISVLCCQCNYLGATENILSFTSLVQ